jgi:hypothetical protein|tara:strand:+ start:117 stop:587 length:471 start_codon:yes stop_codon:yes gene_type:complete
MINVKVIIPIIIIIIIAGVLIIFPPNEKTMMETEIEEEWIKSGPFSIDKNEYNIGEKIFIVVNGLNEEDKGKVIFFRPLNNTSWDDYITMDFDGMNKPKFNLYFEPRLSDLNGICSTNELSGQWVVKFIGTEYSDINFKIINQTSSWDTRTFDPVC